MYCSFLFILPHVINSEHFNKKAGDFVYNKFEVTGDFTNFKVNTYPNLLIKINAGEIRIKDKENTALFDAKNVSLDFDLKKFAVKKLNAGYIFVNQSGFKNIIAKNKNKKASDFKIKQFPEINIDKAEIWAERNAVDSIFIILSNIHITTEIDNKTICYFDAEILSNMLKDIINTGKKSCLYIDDNALYAENIQVISGASKININGKIIDDEKKSDISVKGNNIPIRDAVSALIYFQKLKSPDKKFIENFYNFSGLIDIDIKITEEGLFGACTAKNLAAQTTLFNVPIFFKDIIFKLNKKNMTAAASGILGGEKVFTAFNLTDMGTENQEVKGIVKAKLSNKSAGKYIPKLSIIGYADTSVDYLVKNKKIYVNYLLKLAKKSDLLYEKTSLGLKDKTRRFYVSTLKEADKLYITHYDYSSQDGNKINNIITGSGLLVKKKGHLDFDYITCKTNGYAPVSVAGYFEKYIDKGEFNGDLKYDFVHNILTGVFKVRNTLYKNFFVKEAKIDADKKLIKLEAVGEYNNSPFKCTLNALNNFSNKLNINNMYLFLDEFVINSNMSKSGFNAPAKINDIAKQAKDADIDIEKWTIKLNKIKRNRIELTDILITGSLKNDIFRFSIPHINFAKGLLKAEGSYNMKEHSSDIYYSAANIDSNTVADVIFNLPNQIEGLANATLHAKTKHGIDEVTADAYFSIKQGYLPRLGSTDFIIKNSRKKQPIKF
ncbi:MAG: hypothetical protein LUH11_02175, partial [Candidatus Gastranaerophilales bacterium]|nr:hypothetical protein [Candidatus Gastranaerophilales bacterium]